MSLLEKISLGKAWKPNVYLTDLSIAYFQKDDDFVANKIFPVCPVPLSTSLYYKFDKGDLNRDGVHRKPSLGKVNPIVFGTTDDTYHCKVDQIMVGIDQIEALDYQRARTPGIADPRKAKVQIVVNQMKIHQDVEFAKSFFKTGAWTDEWTGKTSSPDAAQKECYKWSDANFDPVNFFNARKKDIRLKCLRDPNVLALGLDAFNALCEHPDIIDRVKYSGSTPNPAIVNENVLAQIFGVEKIAVFRSVYNKAAVGAADEFEFICDPTDAMLAYVNPAPAIDQPSAGYTFVWDMLGNGAYMALDQYEGEKGTHSEIVEGIMSYDQKKVCDDCAQYFHGVA